MSSSDSDDGVPLSAMVSNGGRLQALEKEGRRANGGSRIADNGDYSGSDSDSVPLSVLSNRIVGTVVNNSNNNNNNVENGSDSESDLPLSGAVRNGAAGSKRVKRELPPAAAPNAAKKFKSEQQPKATKATKVSVGFFVASKIFSLSSFFPRHSLDCCMFVSVLLHFLRKQ